MANVHIYEGDFETAEEVQRALKEALGFPAYYGKNLSALADCLTSAAHPVRIHLTCAQDPTPLASYLYRVALVCMRAAFENDQVELVVDTLHVAEDDAR